MGNKTGLDKNYGNGIAIDTGSNKGASGPSKTIGPISGRIKKYTGTHSAGTGGHDANGMNRSFGNAFPVDEGNSSSPSRGNKDGG